MSEGVEKKEVASSWGAEEERKLLEHVNAKWKDKGCAACGLNSWSIHGFVNLTIDPRPRPTVDIYGGLGLMMGGAACLPSAVMICTSCGATLLVNLVVAGVVPRPVPPTPEGSPA